MMSEGQDAYFVGCQQKIEKSTSIDEKLTLAIEFMKEALSDGAKARFRDFWQMKKVCLELFKGDIHKVKRVAYWEEYTTLLTQAHSLQRILEEQTSFQSEQISLAIDGLERECEAPMTLLPSEELLQVKKIEEGDELIALELESNCTQKLREQALAYRKEILSLEIRISQKNKLLARLSRVSDKIFPKRKKVLNKLTAQFSKCIDKFVQRHFNLEEKALLRGQANYKIREEIKLYQAALRVLTLTNDAYQRIRQTLGKCWDIVAIADKERREEFQQRKNQAPAEVAEELETLKKFQTVAQLEKGESKLVESASKRKVSKEAIYLLKREIGKLRDLFEKRLERDKIAGREEAKKKQEKDEQLYIEALDSLDGLKTKGVRMKLENVESQLEKVMSLHSFDAGCKKKNIVFNHKKQMVERIVIEKKEKLGQKVHDSYLALHKKMRKSVESLRTAKTECSLDIEFALELDGYLEEGRQALEAIEEKF